MFNQVFISHAKEDYKIAEELYCYLKNNNYSPWLDKKNIKVGQDWDFEINKALKSSTFVILLLSSVSVTKRGYVQKEFKKALVYSEEKLSDDIYIIPILLDSCEVPDRLSKYQWIEIDSKNSMEEILTSLNFQREKYLSSLSAEEIDINNFTTMSIEHGINISKDIDYICELPLFKNNDYFDSNFVNTFIQQKALERISDFRSWLDNSYGEEIEHEYYLQIFYTLKQLNVKYMSLSLNCESFFGGAHPNTSIDTLNFAFKPDRILKLYDLVSYIDLHDFLKDVLSRFGDTDQKEILKDYIEYFTNENIEFTFDHEILEIDFTNQIPRVIMALGILEIPFSELNSKII